MVHNRRALLTTNLPFKFQVHMTTHEARMHHNYCEPIIILHDLMVVMRVTIPLIKEKTKFI
jgi:hypothetical protein